MNTNACCHWVTAWFELCTCVNLRVNFTSACAPWILSACGNKNFFIFTEILKLHVMGLGGRGEQIYEKRNRNTNTFTAEVRSGAQKAVSHLPMSNVDAQPAWTCEYFIKIIYNPFIRGTFSHKRRMGWQPPGELSNAARICASFWQKTPGKMASTALWTQRKNVSLFFFFFAADPVTESR